MKALIPIIVASLLPGLVHATNRAHVHGQGHLNMAIDNELVTIELELPLEAIVGFERAPRNEPERKALADADKALGDGGALFRLTPAARCTLQATRVGQPAYGGDHADLDALYVFRCADPAALKELTVTLFRQFGRLERLQVQQAGPSGQRAASLTPARPVLRW